MREMIRRLLELATLFKKVNQFVENLRKDPSTGLLNQVGPPDSKDFTL